MTTLKLIKTKCFEFIIVTKPLKNEFIFQHLAITNRIVDCNE